MFLWPPAFNRTFKELKQSNANDFSNSNGSFNRTFKELKHGTGVVAEGGEKLLIAPLRN